MKKTIKTISAFALVATLSIIAFAAVTFDTSTGIGFAGKGDVQLALGLNNKGLQELGNPSFSYSATTETISEYEWVCTNSNNQNTQERSRTITVTNSTTGVVSSIARERNQITGFTLNGWNGSPSVVSNTTTDGNPLNSCPSNNWVLTPAGDPIVTTNTLGGGLSVNGVSLQ